MAAEALGFGVVDGRLTREETLDFLTGFLKHQEAEPPSDFPSLIASTLYDLYPEEYMEVIENAYKKGMIDPFMIRLEDFQENLELGLEPALQKLRAEYKRRISDDVHGYLESWACFRSDGNGIDKDTFDRIGPRLSSLEARTGPDWDSGNTPSSRLRTPKEAHKNKKKKRKMAQSSRRNNRKRRRK